MSINLHELPRMRDSLSYHYIDQAIVERNQNAIETIQSSGRTLIPAAAISLIMLGPGTNISHAAVKVLMENGCSILWTGEQGMRCYAQGMGETRRSYHLIKQAEMVSDPLKREQVVRRMYQIRFDIVLEPGLTLPQIRGFEGVRIKEAYAQASKRFGVNWQGRSYDRSNWAGADRINRTLSAANALLNGICHAAITAGGYSAGLGFIHTGRMMSFVYDIADLYKTEITIPIAFETAAFEGEAAESKVRERCREYFSEHHLLKRILKDIDKVLDIPEEIEGEENLDPPTALWEELRDDDCDDS
ncbi:MAG: type I-E CRISPR-associated endonuclease Cas1e [Anaerolineaceae bacterium]|nr:type I-E CRISPR-associated endonuclease Cas1e [Anaerolineaceae bacterium]